MKHCLDVSNNGDGLSSEAHQNTGEVVHHVGSLQYCVVETGALVGCSAVKHNTTLAWVTLLENWMVGKVPQPTNVSQLFRSKASGMTINDVLLNSCSVLFMQRCIVAQLSLEVSQTCLCNFQVVWQALRVNSPGNC